jgi:hypothetical protein
LAAICFVSCVPGRFPLRPEFEWQTSEGLACCPPSVLEYAGSNQSTSTALEGDTQGNWALCLSVSVLSKPAQQLTTLWEEGDCRNPAIFQTCAQRAFLAGSEPHIAGSDAAAEAKQFTGHELGPLAASTVIPS